MTSLPLSLIDPSEKLLREIDGATLNDLRESIRLYGVLQPILVRPHGERYQIIFGNHRYYAAKGAGLTEIPAVVKAVDDQETIFLSLEENIQRANMTPVEEGRAFQHLIDAGLSRIDLVRRLGKSNTYVEMRLLVAKYLAPELAVEIGKALTVTNAFHLYKLPRSKQLEVLKEIKERGKSLKMQSLSSGGGGGWGSSMGDPSFSSYCICSKCGNKHVAGEKLV